MVPGAHVLNGRAVAGVAVLTCVPVGVGAAVATVRGRLVKVSWTAVAIANRPYQRYMVL